MDGKRFDAGAGETYRIVVVGLLELEKMDLGGGCMRCRSGHRISDGRVWSMNNNSINIRWMGPVTVTVRSGIS